VLNILELGDSIASVDDLRGKTILTTGMGTTPDYALKAILKARGLTESDVTIEYKSESTEIAALLAGDTAKEGTIAVLPQPYATTVLSKNPEARIALDLTQEWTNAGIKGRLVTGVFIARNEFLEKNSGLVDAFLSDYERSASWVNANVPEAAVMVAELGLVASAEIGKAAIPHCAIVSISGSELKSAVSAYLEVLFEAEPSFVGGALPDDGFYYNA
jgi:NitT/TauT family transport system substrate-binding protein